MWWPTVVMPFTSTERCDQSSGGIFLAKIWSFVELLYAVEAVQKFVFYMSAYSK